MVKVICSDLENRVTSDSGKFLFVNPKERTILVSYPEYLEIAVEIAKKLESPRKEYCVIKCYP